MGRHAGHINAALRQVGVLLAATGVLTCVLEPSQITAGGLVSLIGLWLIWAASPEEED